MLSERQTEYNGEYTVTLGQPLSEEALVVLHKTMLTPGVHYYKARNREAAHNQLHDMLIALDCYHFPGHISTEQYTCKSHLCQNLWFYMADPDQADLMDHVANSQCDFLWLEETPFLKATPWYTTFKHEVQNSWLSRTMPLLVVVCDV